MTPADLPGTRSVWTTVKSFMTLLARDDDDEPDWQALLEAATLSVPGAQGGSLNVRDGDAFVLRAVVGFDPALLGLRQSAAYMRRWYGEHDVRWHVGHPRVLGGEVLRGHIRALRPEPVEIQPERQYEAAGVRQVLRANLCLPIRVGEDVVAELNLDNLDDPHAFTGESVTVAQEFGLLVAAALAAQARRTRERASRDGILKALSLAIEARDRDTHGHTLRVVELAGLLGEALGLSSAALEDLGQGATLHDIGKLSVPDAVLHKPGRLDADEERLMHEHTVRGEALAARVLGVTPGALAVVRHHHERWDGAGYPDGLAGEAIPLLARIFTVVDVFDALTSERPYKHAWTPQEALAEIEAQAGRRFDPHVVCALHDLIRGAARLEDTSA